MGLISRFFKKQEQNQQPLTEDEILELLIEKYNNYKFDRDDYIEIIKQLNEACINCKGTIDNIRLVHIGQDAIILECNNLIIKITTLDYGTESLTQYVSYCDNILKPIKEQRIKIKESALTILIEKKLDTTKVKHSDISKMYNILRDNGYLWYDPKIDNLGKDENGNLILLDYGQIIYIGEMTEEEQKREIETNRNMFPELSAAYDAAKEFEAQFSGKKK